MKIRTCLVVLLASLVAIRAGTAIAGAKDGQSQKLSTALTALYAEHAAHRAQRPGVPFVSRMRPMPVAGDYVAVDALADGDASALEASLVFLGMQHAAVHGRVVSGLLPITAVPALEGVSGLRFARPPIGVRRAGSATTEGDRAVKADVARATSGVNGAGVKVGVISDSFN